MLKIQTSVKGIPYVMDVLAAIKVSKSNIHTIDVSDTECVIIGQNVSPLSFHLMHHKLHIGPNKTHLFIDIKKEK